MAEPQQVTRVRAAVREDEWEQEVERARSAKARA